MFVTRRTLFTTLFVMGLSGAAIAGAPSTGLGQAWPNTADVSASPNYHAYVFVLGGIQYIQINDLNGKVRAAFALSASIIAARVRRAIAAICGSANVMMGRMT